MGAGFLESVYQNALLIALRQKGLDARPQFPLAAKFRGEIVEQFYADILVKETVIVELKAVTALASEHQAQVINYLKATGIEVGLLVNFGRQDRVQAFAQVNSNRIDRMNRITKILPILSILLEI